MSGSLASAPRPSRVAHCAELLAPPPDAKELGARFAGFAQALCKAMDGRLETLLSAKSLDHTVGKPASWKIAALGKALRPAGMHVLAECPDGGPRLLASVGIGAALSLTDRVFGGRGELPDPLPVRMPPSARVPVDRLAQALGEALETRFGLESTVTTHGNDSVTPDPFPGADQCLRAAITVAQDGYPDWEWHLAACPASIAQLARSAERAGDARNGSRGARRSLAEAVGPVPVPLTAELCALRLPAARLAALVPGDLVALPRLDRVRLRAGGHEIAAGAPGAMGGQCAVRIGNAASEGIGA